MIDIAKQARHNFLLFYIWKIIFHKSRKFCS